ncbi:MAG TPA: hypothetical protein VL200_12355 [Lacunisphaera sp.]|jgi:hypothetical protein|nr:hypothetical protein [Lacunisphaera sp.]
MTQVGVPAARRGELADLRLSRNGWDYAVARQGRAFFVRRKPAGAPVSAYGDPRQLVLTTGSHHLQIFWEETGTGRTLVQFPFAYIVATGTWAPVIQTFLAPPEFKSLYDVGEWNGACMQCHTTAPLGRFVGGDRFDSQVAEFGISCEACHGEGAEHIARNRNPLRRFALHLGGQADPTIVNPARLDAYASTLTCGQCHSISAFVDVSDKIAWTQFGRKYRPGQEELPQKFVLQPNTADHAAQKQAILRNNPHYFSDRFWPDGMVRVTGREMNAVLASPCFKGGHFSCVSCHEMHAPTAGDAALPTWADGHQLVAPDDSNAACLQCHREIGAKLAAHTHHAAGSTGSSCYNCHMPHTAFGLLRAIRSHQVSSPSVQETLQQGRPNACNLCHLDKPLGWTAEKLAAWYGRPAPALSDDDRRIAAGVRWLLQGNAGVRALTSWSMGWQPAQQASGRDWLYPYLFTGLNDPYAVVRFIAWRSLRTLPGYGDFPFDDTQEGAHLDAAVHAGYGEWRQRVVAPATFPASTGLAPDGGFEEDIFRRLLHQRDQSPVFIVE